MLSTICLTLTRTQSDSNNTKHSIIQIVCWLTNTSSTRKVYPKPESAPFYMLLHWGTSCTLSVLSNPVTAYWHQANQSQHWPMNTWQGGHESANLFSHWYHLYGESTERYQIFPAWGGRLLLGHGDRCNDRLPGAVLMGQVRYQISPAWGGRLLLDHGDRCNDRLPDAVLMGQVRYQISPGSLL